MLLNWTTINLTMCELKCNSSSLLPSAPHVGQTWTLPSRCLPWRRAALGNYWPFEVATQRCEGRNWASRGHFATSLSNRTSCCSFRNPFGPEVRARSPPPLSGFVTWLVGLVANMKTQNPEGESCKAFFPVFSGWLSRYTDTVSAINRR